MTELPIMKHIVLTTIGCQPCKQLEAYLIANQTTSWSWVYHHIRPELFDVLAVSSTPSLVAQVGPNEYKLVAVGLQECIDYHRVWKHPSSIVHNEQEPTVEEELSLDTEEEEWTKEEEE
jgi:hypothetical protein